MNDHIVIAQHRETLLWHGLLYRNKPTLSGVVRPILAVSTKEGFEDKEQALDEIVKVLRRNLSEDDFNKISVPILNRSEEQNLGEIS